MTDSDLSDWELFQRCETTMVYPQAQQLIDELIRRYRPHADVERPPDTIVWCLDCEWETTIEPEWTRMNTELRAKRAAAGHIANGECESYDYGSM